MLITQYPLYTSTKPIVGFRVDPGDVPDSTFTILQMVFHAAEPE